MKRGHTPGFHFDSKRKLAHFDVNVMVDGRRVSRRRLTVEADDYFKALEKFKTFRAEVLAGREPATFGDYVRRIWPLMRERIAKDSARREDGVLMRTLV